MLTSDTYRELKLFLKLSSVLRNMPIGYNIKTQLIEEISLRSKPFYFFMLSFLGVRVIYHFAWLVSSFWYGFPSVEQTTVEFFYATCLLTAFITNLGFYLDRYSLINHLNQLLRINRIFGREFLIDQAKSKGRHPLSGKKYNDGCALWMRIFTPACYSVPLSFGAFFLLNPNSRLYYYFLLPYKPIWIGAMYFVAESLTYCWNMPCIYFNVYLNLLYLNTCNFWVTEISETKREDSWAKQPLYLSGGAIKVYRSLQILTTQFSNACRWLILPAVHLFAVMTPTVSLFVCVKFHEKLPLPYILTFASSAISCFTYHATIYPRMGNVYEKSRGYLTAGDLVRSKEWRMTKRSMPILTVTVRDNYTMRKHTVLTVFSIVIAQTTNLLVSF